MILRSALLILAGLAAIGTGCCGGGRAPCSDSDGTMCPCTMPGPNVALASCVPPLVCSYGAMTCDCTLIPQQTGLSSWRCGPTNDGGAD